MKKLFLLAAIVSLSACKADGSVDWTTVGDVAAVTAGAAVIGAEIADPAKPPSAADCKDGEWQFRHRDSGDVWECAYPVRR
jgi:hypothetical protein